MGEGNGTHAFRAGKHRVDPNQGYVFDSERVLYGAILFVAMVILAFVLIAL